MVRVGISLALIVLAFVSGYLSFRGVDQDVNMSPTAESDPARAERARAEDAERAKRNREAEAKFWRSRMPAPETPAAGN